LVISNATEGLPGGRECEYRRSRSASSSSSVLIRV